MSNHRVAQNPDYANRVGIPEAAAILGVSQITIRRRIKDGSLPAVLIAGRYRIALVDLDGLVGRAAA